MEKEQTSNNIAMINYRHSELLKSREIKEYEMDSLLHFLENFTLNQVLTQNAKQNTKKTTKKNSNSPTNPISDEESLRVFKKIWKQKTDLRPYHIPHFMGYLTENPIFIDTADLPLSEKDDECIKRGCGCCVRPSRYKYGKRKYRFPIYLDGKTTGSTNQTWGNSDYDSIIEHVRRHNYPCLIWLERWMSEKTYHPTLKKKTQQISVKSFDSIKGASVNKTYGIHEEIHKVGEEEEKEEEEKEEEDVEDGEDGEVGVKKDVISIALKNIKDTEHKR